MLSKITNSIKLVTFDLDGTLVDTLEDLRQSVNQALEELSLPRHSSDSFRMNVGSGARFMIARSLPDDRQDLLDTVLQMQKAYYQEHLCDRSRAYPGIREMLNELKQGEYKLAVLSNKPDPYTREIIERLFEQDIFDIVMGNRQGMPLKPDPGCVLEIAGQLLVSAEQAAFVGDTSIDMQTANRAGMLAVGVSWGFREAEELRENGCQMLIDSPEELPALLSGL